MSGVLSRVDHEGEEGSWTLWRRRPRPALAPYVLEIQGYRERGATPVIRDQLPVPFIPFIVVLGRGFAMKYPERPERVQSLESSFLAGLHREPVRVRSFGEALCLQINFSPLGARRFLRCDLGELAGRVFARSELAVARDLEARLLEVADWPGRFDLLEALLAERILAAPPDDPRVEAAWRLLQRSGGRLRVDALAAELEISRKHLHALLVRQIGAGPKTLARILRFDRAMERLGAPLEDAGLAGLALACGYADQAHFTREVTALAGASPLALRRRLQPDGSGVMAEGW